MKKSSNEFKTALYIITMIAVTVAVVLLGQTLINNYTSLLMGM